MEGVSPPGIEALPNGKFEDAGAAMSSCKPVNVMVKFACNLYRRNSERMSVDKSNSSKQADEKKAKRESELSNLMKLAQAGNKVAYTELLESLKMHLRTFLPYALNISKRGDDGGLEDLLQEILLAVHQKRHTYNPSLPFLPWFYAISRHKMIDKFRSNGSYLRMVEKVKWENSFGAQEVSNSSDQLHKIEEALGSLPKQQREILELTKAEGLTVAETARKTKLSESHVKVLTHRAIQSIRKHFGRQE